MTNKDREFTKLVRKLENKLHLDPEIYKKSNLNSDQADALKNFKTSSNALSVYIADDQEKIPRILAAIAAGCDKPEKVDYAVFEFSILERCGITSYKKCKGKTPDIEVNDLHIDLKDLTVSQVSLLIQNIREEGELERISKKDITEIITDGIQRKLLQKEHVNAKILKFVTSHC